jgi:hypothetical protein
VSQARGEGAARVLKAARTEGNHARRGSAVGQNGEREARRAGGQGRRRAGGMGLTLRWAGGGCAGGRGTCREAGEAVQPGEGV